MFPAILFPASMISRLILFTYVYFKLSTLIWAVPINSSSVASSSKAFTTMTLPFWHIRSIFSRLVNFPYKLSESDSTSVLITGREWSSSSKVKKAYILPKVSKFFKNLHSISEIWSDSFIITVGFYSIMLKVNVIYPIRVVLSLPISEILYAFSFFLLRFSKSRRKSIPFPINSFSVISSSYALTSIYSKSKFFIDSF